MPSPVQTTTRDALRKLGVSPGGLESFAPIAEKLLQSRNPEIQQAGQALLASQRNCDTLLNIILAGLTQIQQQLP